MSDPLNGSAVLLYGVLAAGTGDPFQEVLRRPGVRGRRLTLLPCDSLALLASPIEDPSALRRADVDTVLAYKDIVEAAYAARTLVPLRFGTWADTPADARALVRERATACRKQLDRLDGRVEMGLRLTLAPEQATDQTGSAQETSSGRAYLQARKEQRARGQAPLRPFREVLSPLVVDSAMDRATPEDGVVSVAFLVPRQNVDAFSRRASEVQPPSVQTVQVVGPWAPFSFATLSI